MLDSWGGNIGHPTLKKKYGTSGANTRMLGIDTGSTIIRMTFYAIKMA